MAQVSIEVISKDGNDNTYKKTFSDVNPAATNEQIDAFGRNIVNLSTNTYTDTIKIVKTSMNEELD